MLERLLFLYICAIVLTGGDTASSTLDVHEYQCNQISEIKKGHDTWDLGKVESLGEMIVAGSSKSPQYFYKFSFCGDGSFTCGFEGCELGDASVCRSEYQHFGNKTDQVCLGRHSRTVIRMLESEDFEVLYEDDRPSRTKLYLLCDKSTSGYTTVDDSGAHTIPSNITINLRTKSACPSHRPAISIGTGFLIAFLCISALYCGVGAVINVTRKKKGAEIIPNWSFWKEVPVNVKDGALICCGSSGSQYEPILNPRSSQINVLH